MVERVRVLVCGARLRQDDGAAVLAAERLPPDVRTLAEVEAIGQLDVQSIVDLPRASAVVIADVVVGVAAGQIVVCDLDELAAGGGVAPASSHALPPDQVLALAKELRGSLPRGVFVGIGGEQFGFGERLSPAVDAAIPAFVDALGTEIRRLAAAAEPPRVTPPTTSVDPTS